MAPDPHTLQIEDEVAEIENRKGTRTLFIVTGAVLGLALLVVVVLGMGERMQMREIAARPDTQELALGRLVGTASNTAVFAADGRLSYVEGIGDAAVDGTTTFARRIEYDAAGLPDSVPAAITYWTLVSSDSLPYIVDPVTSPLLGISTSDYRELALGSLSRDDYRSGDPNDWRALEEDATNVAITGTPHRSEETVLLADGPAQVRLQGIQGLSALDSLELAWAVESSAALAAYGRISSTPGAGDPALFVLTLDAVHPPIGTGAAEADTVAPPGP